MDEGAWIRARFVGLVVVTALGLAGVTASAVDVLGGDRQEPGQPRLDAPTVAADPVADSGEGQERWWDAAGPAALPPGSGTVDGLPVGFPSTDLGSVAAAVALSRSQIGFDYAAASRTARAYGDGDTDALVARSREAVAERRAVLGVPVRGTVPAPASFVLTPYAFRVLPISTGRNQVDVLSLVSSTSVRGAVTLERYAGTQVLAWTDTASDQPGVEGDGDWKVTEPTAEDLAHLSEHPAPPTVRPSVEEKLLGLGWTTITVEGAIEGAADEAS